jgi:hypothetical protein
VSGQAGETDRPRTESPKLTCLLNAIVVMYLPDVTCELYASVIDDTFQVPIQGLYHSATMSVAIVIRKQFGGWKQTAYK